MTFQTPFQNVHRRNYPRKRENRVRGRTGNEAKPKPSLVAGHTYLICACHCARARKRGKGENRGGIAVAQVQNCTSSKKPVYNIVVTYCLGGATSFCEYRGKRPQTLTHICAKGPE